jgi:hypothetical protein
MAINPTQQINLVRHEANKTLVKINGINYEFTIKTKVGNGDDWTDITAERDWTEVAKLVSALCKQITNQNSFQKVVLETTGELPGLNNLAAAEPNFHSIQVDYGDKNNLQSCQYDSASLPAEKQKLVAEHVTAMAITSLSNSFATRPPVEVGAWMNRHLQANHPKIYRAITSFIYQTELAKWEATADSPSRGEKPGTKDVRVTTAEGTTVFPKEKYGTGRFVAMQNEERAALLQALKKALINHALNQRENAAT